MTPPPTIAGVCSGIGGFDLGFEQAGYRVLWTCEKDAAARAVLQHRFPESLHLTDMLSDDLMAQAAPDVLVGGTPCQGFSLAGLRGSLSDDRSNLCLRFCELANHFRRSFVLWENVPGVLSTADNAFGVFLAALVGADDALLPSPVPEPGKTTPHWRWCRATGQHIVRWPRAGVVSGPRRTAAWRVLDAQYFGMAQRRKRVFVVADPGDGRAPTVLFESGGLRRDTAPSRQPWQNLAGAAANGAGVRGQPASVECSTTAPTLSARTQGGGGLGTDAELDGGLIAYPLTARPQLKHDHTRDTLIAHTLRGEGFDASEDGTGRGIPLVPMVTGPLCANGKAAGSATQQDAEQDMLVAECVAFSGRARGDDGRGYDRPEHVDGPIAGSLDTIKPPRVALAFSCKDHGADASMEVSPTLRAMNFAGSHLNGGGQVAVAFGGNNTSGPVDVAPALNCNRGCINPGDFEAGLRVEFPPQSRPDCLAFPERMGSTAVATASPVSPALGALNPMAIAIQDRAVSTNLNAGPNGIGCSTENVAYTLDARPHPQMVAFQPRVARNGRGLDTTGLVHALNGADAGATSDMRPCVAIGSFQQNSMDGAGSLGFEADTHVLHPVCPAPDHQMIVQASPPSYAVRRLTPRECDRLQGFPDDWGLIPTGKAGKKLASDSARYKQLGNAVNVACSSWLARRLLFVLRPDSRVS